MIKNILSIFFFPGIVKIDKREKKTCLLNKIESEKRIYSESLDVPPPTILIYLEKKTQIFFGSIKTDLKKKANSIVSSFNKTDFEDKIGVAG